MTPNSQLSNTYIPSPDPPEEQPTTEESLRQAVYDRVLEAIRPTSGRLVVTQPKIAEDHTLHKLESGLIAPARNTERYHEFGHVCTVLKVGPECPDEFSPGIDVIISEFSGVPLLLEGNRIPYWIIGYGDAMAIVEYE